MSRKLSVKSNHSMLLELQLNYQQFSHQQNIEVLLALGSCSDECIQKMEKSDLFARLKHGKDVIHSELYTRATKRNSSVVAFQYKGHSNACFGAIMYYLRCKFPCSNALCEDNCTCTNKTFLAMIKRFQSDPRGLLKSSSLKGPLAVAIHLVVVERHKFTLVFQFPISSINAFSLTLVQTIFMWGQPPTQLNAISSEFQQLLQFLFLSGSFVLQIAISYTLSFKYSSTGHFCDMILNM